VRPETLAELTQWVDRFAAHSEQLKGDLEKLVLALYAGQNFYDAAAVTSIGAQAANSSNAQAVIAAGLAAQYVATTTGIITGHPVQTPTLVLAALRNGADMAKVYERPVKLFRRLRARGVSPADAFARAMQLASAIYRHEHDPGAAGRVHGGARAAPRGRRDHRLPADPAP
jgi:hypothetical protein